MVGEKVDKVVGREVLCPSPVFSSLPTHVHFSFRDSFIEVSAVAGAE